MAPISRAADLAPAAAPSAEAVIAGLRASGAHRVDALAFGLIEALARRANGRDGALGHRLQRRLGDLLQAYGTKLERANAQADQWAERLQRAFPQARQQIQRYRVDSGLAGLDGAGGLRQQAQRLETQAALMPLADLLTRLHAVNAAATETPATAARPSDAPSANAPERSAAEAPAELRALSQFRQSWARLEVAQQLKRAAQQAPENAGPLNSQGLVLRALQQLQAISPDYLDRLVSQIEALMWLERAESQTAPVAPRSSRREPAKPARPTRRHAAGKTL